MDKKEGTTRNIHRLIFFLLFIFLYIWGCLPFQTMDVGRAETTSVQDWVDNREEGGLTANEEKGGLTANDEEAEGSVEQSASIGPSFFDVIKMIGSFILVIGLLLLVLKWLQKKGRSFTPHGIVENLGGASLGHQKSIQLVKIGDHIFIVGVGDSVQLLKEVDDKKEIEQLLQQHNGDGEKVSEKSRSIDHWLRLVKGESNASFLQSFKIELSSLKQSRKKMLAKWDEKKGSADHE